MRGLLSLREHDIAAAHARLTEIEARWATLRFDNAYLHSLMLVGDLASALHDQSVCAITHERAAPWADQFAVGMTGHGGPIRRTLGVTSRTLGRVDEALDHFSRAAASVDRRRAPLWWLRCATDELETRALHTTDPAHHEQAADIARAAAELGLVRPRASRSFDRCRTDREVIH